MHHYQQEWLIHVDLKMLNFLLGQQSWLAHQVPVPSVHVGLKGPSSALHEEGLAWPLYEELVPCRARKIINNPLVDQQDALPTAAHQGQLDHSVHQISGQGWWLLHLYTCARLSQNWPWRSWKLASLQGLKTLVLIRDPELENSMNKMELEAWKAFVLAMKNFTGSKTAAWNYAELVTNMTTACRNLRCNMSIKIHYLFSHKDQFPENLGSVSNKQGASFHQDMKEIKTRHQGPCQGCRHEGYYCWTLKRDRHPCCWAF